MHMQLLELVPRDVQGRIGHLLPPQHLNRKKMHKTFGKIQLKKYLGAISFDGVNFFYSIEF